MKKQSRDNNNSVNPLIKVSALSISRAYEKIGKNASCYSHIKLNFKRSSDILGKTYDKNDRAITVNFALSIRKATLDVKFKFENPEDSKYVRISKVAFVESLSTNRSMADAEEVNSLTNIEGSIKGEGTFGINTTSRPVAQIKTEAKGSRIGSRRRNKVRKTNANYKVTGITATHAGNVINWDINSLWTRNEEMELRNTQTYLSGEVFKDPISGKHIYACRVIWNHAQVSSGMEIHGSVRVMMQDLLIEDILFLDELGGEQSWADIKTLSSEEVKLGIRDKIGFDREEFKKRLVRQVIRKHLISQGMDLQGASVEICAAYG